MATKQVKEEKLTAREKRAVKRREAIAKADAVFGVGKGFGEPEINPLNYTADLIKALNHYNVAHDNKTKRKWAMAYISRKNKATAKALENIKSDWEFGSLGTICRLRDREQPLQDKEIKFIDKRIKELLEQAKSLKPVSQIKTVTELPMKPKVDKNEELLKEVVGEINGMLDDFLKEDKEVDVESLLKSMNVPSAVAKQIPAKFEKMLAELEEVQLGKDKQLVEGYSNIKKIKLRKLIAAINSITAACQQQAVSAKTVRKPRVKKEKPASVVAAKVKFLQESKELGIKSVHPTNLVGASEVWIFNTKYKKLQVYRALDQQKLTVKGTTLLNYDVSNSSSKTIRKVEQIKDVATMTKRTFATFFKNLKTKDAAVNGRINEECLIVKVL